MVDLNLREQYKPDMTALQLHMYQFTRLLLDKFPDIYLHLEANDITTSLYAAPWFLSIKKLQKQQKLKLNLILFLILALYSSQFQMGFVARVFDFLPSTHSNHNWLDQN